MNTNVFIYLSLHVLLQCTNILFNCLTSMTFRGDFCHLVEWNLITLSENMESTLLLSRFVLLNKVNL